MPNSEPWTVERLLNWTADYLKTNGSDQPRLEADLLLAHALGCERIDLYASQFKTEPEEEAKASFRDMVKRRANGEPTAYLLGRKEFYSLPFRVTADVLIPRPETEFLVISLLDEAAKLALQAAANATENSEEINESAESESEEQEPEVSPEPPSPPPLPFKIIDVGTGSGAVAICAAKYLPASDVTAVDLSSAAIEVAQGNARDLQTENIRFEVSDLLESIDLEKRFDFIISNPPYISQTEFDALPPLIKNFEPTMALVGGNSGCEIIERLIPQAAVRLKPGGFLMLEISPMIESQVTQLLEADGRFYPPTVAKDLSGQPRVVKAKRGPEPWAKK